MCILGIGNPGASPGFEHSAVGGAGLSTFRLLDAVDIFVDDWTLKGPGGGNTGLPPTIHGDETGEGEPCGSTAHSCTFHLFGGEYVWNLSSVGPAGEQTLSPCGQMIGIELTYTTTVGSRSQPLAARQDLKIAC